MKMSSQGFIDKLTEKKYYQLITSLPSLPRFDQVETLPISRERLLQRLKMLERIDYEKADRAVAFLAWRRQPVGRTPIEMVEIFNKGIHLFTSPILKEMFEFPVNQRTLLAALRRKEMGLPEPTSKELWGVGSLIEPIKRNWNDPFFKLKGRFPWLVEAKTYLDEGESLKLDYFLFNLTWGWLDRMVLKNYFGFEAVIAYLMKWDMIEQWLSYKKEKAKEHFEQLIIEVEKEYDERTK